MIAHGKDIKVFCGNSNTQLAQDICKIMGTKLGEAEVKRFADGEVGDQSRVTTPARAREIGSEYIVVGRPITKAADPVAAYRRCVNEFVKGE